LLIAFVSYQLIAVVISCYQLASLDIKTFFRDRISALNFRGWQFMAVVISRCLSLSLVIS